MRPRDSDSGSDETTPGRESWRSARGQELLVLSTPRPRGRGKRRPERREGAAKRPRVESSSSDRRDGSEESRSGGGRDRPGRCSQRAARPSTPPRRPIPASVSPRRSPQLTKSAVQGLRSLPLTTKGGRRTAHSRSVSGDERGQGPSRSSLSSSDHGRSSQGRRSQSREPTPPQLRNFDVGDFTVVSHTTDSFTFAIRPIRERAVASSSSAGGTITREMVAEACDTLVQERHPASPPVWPESNRGSMEDQPAEQREAGVLAEPPTPQRKLASTPAPQGDGSPRGTERKPESALFSPSPVVGQEQAPPVCSRVPETESSESDAGDEPGQKEDPPHRGARLAGERDRSRGSWRGGTTVSTTGVGHP